jgi:hypothetical protein
MLTLKRTFTMFLHILVKHNPSNRIENKLIIYYVYHDVLEYIYMKIQLVIVYWKIKIHSKNNWNDF